MYPDTNLMIDGIASDRAGRTSAPVLNPATSAPIGHVECATKEDLVVALETARRGFETWRNIPAFDRYRLMRKAAELLRARVAEIAPILTLEQGKPIAEARGEILAGADTIDWFAEEARRVYGRAILARSPSVRQSVRKEPIGPVAAFTPWNFPVMQALRKIAPALAAGCSIIVKGPEETPASCAAMVRCFFDAGVPRSVVSLVFGDPAQISECLISDPIIRKVSFTGSTGVGRHLSSLAGKHLKRTTMELGGHAPVIVFPDVDIDAVLDLVVAQKFRNAGQVCVSPTRFLVHDQIHARFVDGFVKRAGALKVGSGLDEATSMGPLANVRRLEATERLIADATSCGATVRIGGKRIGNEGYFFEPTVLSDVPVTALIMNDEPFGPIAPINAFDSYEAAVAEANRLPYGLAAYAYTASALTAQALAEDVCCGMLSINHQGLGLPEAPFGGIKDSGFGSEGGTEAMDDYLITRFLSQETAPFAQTGHQSRQTT